ncbi:unnamed protein product [Rangifer tarandus platyrhynchus]|uniref:Uncharacterized protein n=1 Tax=Rangifer tarandus platyrhynchus TaxID=3082113 RepID=A0ABN8Y9N6_RANTA|nr:unnamed protein product [Rangifer tarandus platyrhynchus]
MNPDRMGKTGSGGTRMGKAVAPKVLPPLLYHLKLCWATMSAPPHSKPLRLVPGTCLDRTMRVKCLHPAAGPWHRKGGLLRGPDAPRAWLGPPPPNTHLCAHTRTSALLSRLLWGIFHNRINWETGKGIQGRERPRETDQSPEPSRCPPPHRDCRPAGVRAQVLQRQVETPLPVPQLRRWSCSPHETVFGDGAVKSGGRPQLRRAGVLTRRADTELKAPPLCAS